MFCNNCGVEIRNGAKFCQSCGQSLYDTLDTSNLKIHNNKFIETIKKIGKKKLIAIVAGVYVIIFAVSAFSRGSSSIIGSWEHYDGAEIAFSENGEFTYGRHYGTYTIYDDKQLVLIYKDFDYLGKQKTYDWEEEWYVDNDKLVLNGTEYFRK